jgi:hypothetical protein
MNKVKMKLRIASTFALLAAIPALAACGSSASGSGNGGGKLSLVAY